MPIEKSSSVGISAPTVAPPSPILSGEQKRQYESDVAANANANWFYNEYLPKVARGEDAPETIGISVRESKRHGTPVTRFSSTENRNKQYSEGGWTDRAIQQAGVNFEDLALEQTKKYLALGPDDTILLNGRIVQSSNLTESQRQLAQQVADDFKKSESAYKSALEREQQQLKQGMLESPSAVWASPSTYNDAFKAEYGRNAIPANTEWVRTSSTDEKAEAEQRALKESMFTSPDTVWGSKEDIQAGYARVAKYNPDVVVPKEFNVPRKSKQSLGYSGSWETDNTGSFNPIDPYGTNPLPAFESTPISEEPLEKDQYMPWDTGFFEDAYRDTNRILKAFGGEWLGSELEARYARDIMIRRGEIEGVPATPSKYIPEWMFRGFEDIGLTTARIIREEPIVPVSSYFGMKAFGAGLGAVAKYSPTVATGAGLVMGADYAYQTGKKVLGSETPGVTLGATILTEFVPMSIAGRGMKFEVPNQRSTFFSDSYHKMFGYSKRYPLSDIITNTKDSLTGRDFMSNTQASFEMDQLLGRRTNLLKKLAKNDPWAKGDFAKNEAQIEALRISESTYGERSVSEVKQAQRKMPNEWKAPKTETVQGQVTDTKSGSLISIMEKPQLETQRSAKIDMLFPVEKQTTIKPIKPKIYDPVKWDVTELSKSDMEKVRIANAQFEIKGIQTISEARILHDSLNQKYGRLLKPLQVETGKQHQQTKSDSIQVSKFKLFSGEDTKLISGTKQRTDLISKVKQKQSLKAVPINIFKTDLASTQDMGLTATTKSIEKELTQQTTKQNTEQRTRQITKPDLKYRFEIPQITQQLFKIDTPQITREKFPEPERPREPPEKTRKIRIPNPFSDELEPKKKRKRRRTTHFFRTPRDNPFHEADFGFENKAFMKAWEK